MKLKFWQILLGDKNATSLCSKNISTLLILFDPILGKSYCRSVQNSGDNYFNCCHFTIFFSFEQSSRRYFFRVIKMFIYSLQSFHDFFSNIMNFPFILFQVNLTAGVSRTVGTTTLTAAQLTQLQLGTVHILRKHLNSSKLNLTTKF